MSLNILRFKIAQSNGKYIHINQMAMASIVETNNEGQQATKINLLNGDSVYVADDIDSVVSSFWEGFSRARTL